MSITWLKGGTGPDWLKLVRHEYYERRRWIGELEERISRTEAGLSWLVRVKRAGYA